MRETQTELMMVYPKEAVISKELAVMTRKLRLSMSMEQVFDEFARRVDMEDVRNFSVVFTAAKKSGGRRGGIPDPGRLPHLQKKPLRR